MHQTNSSTAFIEHEVEADQALPLRLAALLISVIHQIHLVARGESRPADMIAIIEQIAAEAETHPDALAALVEELRTIGLVRAVPPRCGGAPCRPNEAPDPFSGAARHSPPVADHPPLAAVLALLAPIAAGAAGSCVRSSHPPLAHPALTRREQDVLAGIVNGLTNADIARCHGIGIETVKTHASRLLHKFEARSRTELMVKLNRIGPPLPPDKRIHPWGSENHPFGG